MLKIFGAIFLAAVLTGGATLASMAAWVATGGMAVCDVDTSDVKIKVPVPTRLADLGLVVARFAIPDEDLRDIRAEAGQYRPLIEGVLHSLADLPEGTTLVSVRTDHEDVLIAREGNDFVVDVLADDTDVRITFPAKSFHRLANGVGKLLGG